jgi:hypothetical protein
MKKEVDESITSFFFLTKTTYFLFNLLGVSIKWRKGVIMIWRRGVIMAWRKGIIMRGFSTAKYIIEKKL